MKSFKVGEPRTVCIGTIEKFPAFISTFDAVYMILKEGQFVDKIKALNIENNTYREFQHSELVNYYENGVIILL